MKVTGRAHELDDPALALRAAVLKMKAPQAAKRSPAPTSSVYGRAAAAVPADVKPPAERSALRARFRNIETTALVSGTSMVLVVLPDAGPIPPDLLRSLELLKASRATVMVLGADVPRSVDPSSILTISMRADDDLHQEWALLALGPRKRVAFLARKGSDDRWDWLVTTDAVAVHRAGTAILERVPFLRLRVPVLDS